MSRVRVMSRVRRSLRVRVMSRVRVRNKHNVVLNPGQDTIRDAVVGIPVTI